MNYLILFLLINIVTIVFTQIPDKVVCYYDAESPQREIVKSIALEYLDPFLCTHLVYAYVGLATNGQIIPINSHLDDDINHFQELREINRDLKLLVSIGGWKLGSKTFSSVIGSPTLRSAFINNIVNFVKGQQLDGVDIDWEYPGDRGGSSSDKRTFIEFLKGLRSGFDEDGLILSATVGAASIRRSVSYNVPELNKYVDFINVMAYSLNGVWDHVTGHPAPLISNAADKNKDLNVQSIIKGWIESGASPSKIVLGVAFYGRSYTLKDYQHNYVGAATTGPGSSGNFSRVPGELSYLEICSNIKYSNWKLVWDNGHKVPYAYSGYQWVGFDNVRSIGEKIELIYSNNLGGIMIWSIDDDDVYDFCDDGRYPLLNAIKSKIL